MTKCVCEINEVKLPSCHLKSDLESNLSNINIWTRCEFYFCPWLYCYHSRSGSRRHEIDCLATGMMSITIIYFMHYLMEVSYLGDKTN